MLILAYSTTFSQLPLKDGNVVYEVVDTVRGTKSELYIKAKTWMIHAFKDAKEVIQSDDKETGEIIGKGSFRYSYTYFMTLIPGVARFTITLSLRDGKYRAIIRDFNMTQGTRDMAFSLEDINQKPDKNPNKKIIEAVDTHVKLLIESFRQEMNAQKKDDF